jgi:hypothetical protein
MSFWNRFADILELLGQRLQTPEYLMCCGGEMENELNHAGPPANPPRPLTTTPGESAAVGQAAKLSLVDHSEIIEREVELNVRNLSPDTGYHR